MIYTVPSLSAVDFALTAHTPVDTSPATQALALYTLPSLSAVDFALTVWTPPTYLDVGWELLPDAGSFPTQFSGLRTFYAGGMVELCLVATADANTGNQLRLRKGATTYCVYLVDTSDPQASHVRIETTAGTKAVRMKT